jgi:parallel beta-helix repeat protein
LLVPNPFLSGTIARFRLACYRHPHPKGLGPLTNNTVTNNVWSPCIAVATCAALATNILVYQSDGITVSNNNVSVSQIGIFIAANNATLTGNSSTANSVFDGIHFEGNSNEVRTSTVVNASESGIYVDGNSNVIENNTITEAAVGILSTTGSTGNLISGNNIFDCPVSIQGLSANKPGTWVQTPNLERTCIRTLRTQA